MKYNHLKVLIGLILAILIVVAGFLVNLYIIGEPVDGVQIHCTVSARGKTLNLQAEAVESAVALRDWTFKQEGSTLFISARKVPLSPLFSNGSFQSDINLDGVESVSLGGRLIWSAEKEE